jgi:segregation and condensation protein B
LAPDPKDLSGFDRELTKLPADKRRKEWMRRVEAVLFASATPVTQEALARVVGADVVVEVLIEDLIFDLMTRPYDVVRIGAGWALRTKPVYQPILAIAADVGGQSLGLNEFDCAVLGAIAFYQPIGREELKDIFGKEISRDLIGRLTARGLIGIGPREPRRGAPYTFVTTQSFLNAFGLKSLQDLPDLEQLADAGLTKL